VSCLDKDPARSFISYRIATWLLPGYIINKEPGYSVQPRAADHMSIIVLSIIATRACLSELHALLLFSTAFQMFFLKINHKVAIDSKGIDEIPHGSAKSGIHHNS